MFGFEFGGFCGPATTLNLGTLFVKRVELGVQGSGFRVGGCRAECFRPGGGC